jgi:hypothetical protein
MNLFTPSLMYEDGIFGLKLVGQFYLIDNDVTQEEDVQLEGYNLKASGRVTFIPEMLRFYATGAFRSNDRVDLPDTTELAARQFRGSFASAGLDFDFDRLGLPDLSIGGNYFFIFQYLSDPSEELDPPPIPQEFTFHYINVGATYWLWDDVVSTGFRWARLMADTNEEQPQPVLHTVDSFIFSLRLII